MKISTLKIGYLGSSIFLLYASAALATTPAKTLGQYKQDITKLVNEIEQHAKVLHNQGPACSSFVNESACPSVRGVVSAKQGFISPTQKTMEELKKFTNGPLQAADQELSKPLDKQKLEKANACSGGQNVAAEDYKAKKTALDNVHAEASTILDGVTRKVNGKDQHERGMREQISELYQSTADFNRMSRECASAVAAKRGAMASAGLGFLKSIGAEGQFMPKNPYEGLRKTFDKDGDHPSCAPNVVNSFDALASPGNGLLAKLLSELSGLQKMAQEKSTAFAPLIAQTEQAGTKCKDEVARAPADANKKAPAKPSDVSKPDDKTKAAKADVSGKPENKSAATEPKKAEAPKPDVAKAEPAKAPKAEVAQAVAAPKAPEAAAAPAAAAPSSGSASKATEKLLTDVPPPSDAKPTITRGTGYISESVTEHSYDPELLSDPEAVASLPAGGDPVPKEELGKFNQNSGYNYNSTQWDNPKAVAKWPVQSGTSAEEAFINGDGDAEAPVAQSESPNEKRDLSVESTAPDKNSVTGLKPLTADDVARTDTYQSKSDVELKPTSEKIPETAALDDAPERGKASNTNTAELKKSYQSDSIFTKRDLDFNSSKDTKYIQNALNAVRKSNNQYAISTDGNFGSRTAIALDQVMQDPVQKAAFLKALNAQMSGGRSTASRK